ncbi:glycosyltransferase family 1 protein [Algoriphagus sp. Y33]|uniref:glycosyltransferase family 4 protein n=1 Tax=Algoriphagus sp. Y33 TaxID=2772483 RepID=UPI001783CED7|nr:glycosyltransferase family 1 protein [Algoriphagus sp. Y33]
MSKPKILIDVFYLHVAQTGIRTYMMSLCREVEKNRGTELDYLITPDFRKLENSVFFKGKTAKWKNLSFQLLYFIRKQVVIPFLSYYHKASIVFSPDIMSPFFARGKKVSVIHDTFFWDNPEHYNKLWLNYYLFFLRQGLAKNGSIITITEFSKARLTQLGKFQHSSIRVVYPASDLQPVISDVGNPFPFRYFLHVGVMEKRKNLGMLVEAFAKLAEEEGFQDCKLVLVGQRGPREALDDFDRIRSLVRQFGIEDRVLFPGYVSSSELSAYFSHALAYIFPSLNEGFGLPVLEAFSYNLPVIISNQGALIEVAGGAAMILKENTVSSLYQSMRRILLEPELRESLISKGRIRLQDFSTLKFFLLLEANFKEILDA